MTREEIEGLLDEGIVFFDGFDDAIVGLGTRFGVIEPIIVYNKDKVIEILMEDMVVGEEDKDEDEEVIKFEMANEYFEYNVIGAWVGDRTPMFIEFL